MPAFNYLILYTVYSIKVVVLFVLFVHGFYILV